MYYRIALLQTAALLLLAAGLAACAVPAPAPASTPNLARPPNTAEPTQTSAPVTPERIDRIDIAEDLYVREVQAGAFVVTHAFPWPGNSLLIDLDGANMVLVDTPYTPEATASLLEWAATHVGPRSVTAVNTGFHYDNLGGNAFLVQQGIPVYGSELTAELLQERGETMREMTLDWLQAPQHQRYREAHAALPYVAPTHLFELENGLVLTFGEHTVQVYYPGPSHAPDNLAVYFPDRRLLFGGCMIVGPDRVGNTSDADLTAWPGSVRNLSRFDFDLLVPGHGERVDPGLLQHTLDLLADFHEG